MKITPEDVCFVVVSYKRPWNIPSIVQAAERYGFGEVYIWDNSGRPEELEKWLIDEAPDTAETYRIGYAAENCYTMGRYVGAIRACEKDIIATCDDDYLVTNRAWGRMLSHWDGRKIVAQLPQENNQYEAAKGLPYLNLGYGSLFDKEWAREAFAAIESVTKGSQNEIIVKKADRCFTSYHQRRTVLKAEFGKHLLKLRNPDGQFSETDKYSIHLTKEHMMDSHRAISLGIQAQEAAVDLLE